MNNKKYQLATIQIISKLVDLLISPKTTLPWILHTVSGPMWVAGMLVPIREAGALLPQWYLKSHVLGSDPRRDTYWRLGIAIQALAIFSLPLCFYLLSGFNLAVGLMGLIAILSFGRALSSLCVKDIQGHLIAKGKRGQFNGFLSSAAGIASIVSAIALIFPSQSSATMLAYGILIVAGMLLVTAYILSLSISVELDKTESTPASVGMWSLLKSERALRCLVIQRGLLLQSALMAPYFTLYILDVSDLAVGWLVLMSAIATTLSSYIWGKFADKNNLQVSRIAAVFCIVSSASLLLLDVNLWILLALFLLLQIAHSGIRIHRKTYILDITNEQNRTAYVATANTMTGIILLVVGATYTVLYPVLGTSILWLMMFFLGIAIVHSQFLPSPNNKNR